MSEILVQRDIENGVAQISLDRPTRRNALTRAMIGQLTQAVRESSSDPQVRLITLTASGSVFCAGMDLAEMEQRASGKDGPEQWLEDSMVYCDLLLAILETPQPTMALVQGPAVAGGVGIVLACDLVLAADDAFFSLPEAQRGITASMVTPLLVFRSGAGHASHLLLSGQRVLTTTMSHWGLCHQVVPAIQLASAAQEWISSILNASPPALAATKQQIRTCSQADLVEQLRQAAHHSAQSRGSADAREGLQAFLEKRKPQWSTR